LGSSFGYYVLFSLFLAIVSTIVVSLAFIPKFAPGLKKISSELITYYPEELTIQIKNGVATTNVKEPYAIKLPGDFTKTPQNYSSVNEPAPENLVVIDTSKKTSDVSLGALKEAKTVIFVVGDGLIAAKRPTELQVIPFKDTPDVTINRAFLTNLGEKIRPYLKFIIPVLVFFIFLVSFLAQFGRLVYLLIAALLIWIVVRLLKIKTDYGRAFQIALHAVTLPAIISLVVVFSGLHIFIFGFTILLLLVVVINLMPREKDAA
jgi:hypothetical protein